MRHYLHRLLYRGLDYIEALRWQITGPYATPGELARPALACPVLILPGVYERWWFMNHIIRALHLEGHPVHIVEVLGYNTTEIPEAAARVARYIESRDLHGIKVVAHSKGGLIGKYLMAHHDPGHRVEQLVAVATPFAGSRYARYFLSRAVRSFAPEDAVIMELATNTAINHRIVSIYGHYDPHIPEGSSLPGATNVELPVMGHFRILKSPLVLEAVLRHVGMQSASGGR
jgi:pimeloyl-ACP methyl ester carboxylesterase